MVMSAVVAGSLIGLAAYLGQAVRKRPESLAAATAILGVEVIDASVAEIVGHPEPALTILAGSLFLFIAVCNLSGQVPGLHPPTACLTTTSALAVLVFLAVPAAGIRALGVKAYVKHYLSPNPLLMPLHMISEFSRTLALALRLFGNISAGHLVVALLVMLAGFLVPIPIMALDLLIGLLQAYVFAILTLVYIGSAIEAGGQE
jgi:F-type H+-transporting ATPase subunit a